MSPNELSSSSAKFVWKRLGFTIDELSLFLDISPRALVYSLHEGRALPKKCLPHMRVLYEALTTAYAGEGKTAALSHPDLTPLFLLKLKDKKLSRQIEHADVQLKLVQMEVRSAKVLQALPLLERVMYNHPDPDMQRYLDTHRKAKIILLKRELNTCGIQKQTELKLKIARAEAEFRTLEKLIHEMENTATTPPANDTERPV
jgi:hypothetical protein